jgi:hypothetical protein
MVTDSLQTPTGTDRYLHQTGSNKGAKIKGHVKRSTPSSHPVTAGELALIVEPGEVERPEHVDGVIIHVGTNKSLGYVPDLGGLLRFTATEHQRARTSFGSRTTVRDVAEMRWPSTFPLKLAAKLTHWTLITKGQTLAFRSNAEAP